ncbi:MAG: hypothetical protein LUQ38_09270 [Methanotrichaceae archaeon]|nr:hypothetical protein [Methanotrichaceae archaeon]
MALALGKQGKMHLGSSQDPLRHLGSTKKPSKEVLEKAKKRRAEALGI